MRSSIRDCSDDIVDKILRDLNTLRVNRPQTFLLCHHLTENDWRYFAQYGVDDYLLKSMNSQQILERIDLAIIPDNKLRQKPNLDRLA